MLLHLIKAEWKGRGNVNVQLCQTVQTATRLTRFINQAVEQRVDIEPSLMTKEMGGIRN